MRTVKLIICIFVVLSIAIGASAAGPDPKKPLDPKAVKTSDGIFAIVPPTDWTADKSGAYGTKLLIIGPTVQDFAVNINLVTEKVGTLTLKQYKALGIKGAKSSLENYKLISDNAATANGYSAWEIVATHEYNNMTIKMKQVLFIHKKVAYVVTFSALDTTYADYIKVFNAAVQTIRFLK